MATTRRVHTRCHLEAQSASGSGQQREKQQVPAFGATTAAAAGPNIIGRSMHVGGARGLTFLGRTEFLLVAAVN